MQRKKAHIDARIQEANIDKGIIVLLTGNGKGKSSSALGNNCLWLRTIACRWQ
jgi:cob(I)alamin adenosyltransferase